MFQPLYVAATGLSTFEDELLAITNNMANAQTTAYKKGRVDKESLFYVQKSFKDVLDQTMDQTQDVTPEFGTGVRVSATPFDFSQGKIDVTNNQLDIAIQGEGFFKFRMADGTYSYGRAGNLHADNDGNIVDPNGHILEPGIVLPEGTTAVVIQQDGTVLVQVNNEMTQTQIGQITLTRFNNPAGLKSLGQNLYAETDASGAPIAGYAADSGFGTLAQYSLESSNVDVISEMMRMVMVQRLFDSITKAVTTYEAILSSIDKMKQS